MNITPGTASTRSDNLPLPHKLSGTNRRIVGVDAGGSATRVVRCGDDRCTLARPRPRMNALLTPNIPEQLAEIASAESADLLGVGMPGVRTAASAAELSAATTNLCGVPTLVVEDVEAALAGAFLGEPGIVVAAGTGTIALGRAGTRVCRAGGHGFLLGDEGGAYWIGREAVVSALRDDDGRDGSPRLREAIVEHAQCDLQTLVARVHRSPGDRSLLAAIAPLVTALAAEDDVACRIVHAAADHLAELSETITGKLGELPVAGIGGVFQAEVVWERFVARCGAVRPQAQPAVGAALLAAEGLL